MHSSWGHSWHKSWGKSWGDTEGGVVPPQERIDTAGSSGGGPDVEVSLSDWLRRFGRKTSLPPELQEDDEEAIALLLCAIAAESLTLQ